MPSSRRIAYAANSASVIDRKSTRLNSSHSQISYAVFCLTKDTESNNLALKGAAHFARAHPTGGSVRGHLIALTTEHKCVLESAAELEREGFAVSYLPVEPGGSVSLDRLAAALSERTLLVSVMAAHNEIGVIQPLAEIGALCRAQGVLFHTDAAQAAGKIPLDVEGMKIHLMSISGHKMYGPTGVGALYILRR